MSTTEPPFSLPRPGPFLLRSGFARPIFWKTTGITLLGLIMGSGFLAMGVHTAGQILRTHEVWTRGREAAEGTLEGHVTTSHAIFLEYHLKLDYLTPEGQRQQSKVEFARFFSGPKENDPFSVRYLPSQPNRATISWAYEARGHQWAWVAVCCVFGLGMILGVVFVAFERRGYVARSRRLAQYGELIRADITGTQTKPSAQKGASNLVYSYSYQRDRHYDDKHTVTGPEQAPFVFDNGKALILLAAPNSREHVVLLYNGYPLELGLTPGGGSAAVTAAPPPSP